VQACGSIFFFFNKLVDQYLTVSFGADIQAKQGWTKVGA
jgi:hypothetical protein